MQTRNYAHLVIFSSGVVTLKLKTYVYCVGYRNTNSGAVYIFNPLKMSGQWQCWISWVSGNFQSIYHCGWVTCEGYRIRISRDRCRAKSHYGQSNFIWVQQTDGQFKEYNKPLRGVSRLVPTNLVQIRINHSTLLYSSMWKAGVWNPGLTLRSSYMSMDWFLS